ncbi:lipase family protein [Helicobacter fennelliae]|uniref:Lipase family protein n=1 Tax=Helicobacter fennelliae TaxID=215 RepID=A0A2X3B9C4_9HELI|nr:hypothetical protein [Helicobacter fennelliae]SQB98357.1 lipase family protein [Helicobacter fennelliae]
MEKNKNIIEHLNDFGKGVYDTFLVTPYNFGDFLGRISGLRDWQNGSVVIKDYYQQETIEEVKLFWRGIASINSWDRAKILFNLAKNEIKNRPMYYLGSFASSGFMSSAIKTGSKVGDIAAKGTFTTTMTSTKILANIREFYPSFKTLNNNICSLYSNNKNYTNLFNQDIIMCSFLQNDNQELTPQPQDLQQEKQKFYYNIQKTNTEFNSYKPIPIISFANPKVAYIQKLNPNNIDSLTKDSPIHLLNALYQCEDYILLDENKEAIVNKKSFNYTSSFYLSFLSNQDSVTDKYLEARKSLYKSISQLKQEKQKQELQELQKQQEKALRDKQRQEQQQARLNKHSNLILESQDKSITIIFLDKLNSNVTSSSNNVQFFNNISMSHLLHIHNNKIDIFTKDKTYLDIQELESLLQEYMNTNTESNNTKQDSPISLDILNSPSTQIFLDSTLLTGSSEIETNPFLFGQLDKDNTIKQDTPTYHFSPKDKENNLGTLTIFLNSCTLTLLNYSLQDSSLNIKLTLTNKESKEKQQQAKDKTKQQTQPEQLKPLSTAMLHPILEDNEIKCPHNGVVQLKSNLGKSITDKNIPFILESDLLYSSIVGCPNPPTKRQVA